MNTRKITFAVFLLLINIKLSRCQRQVRLFLLHNFRYMFKIKNFIFKIIRIFSSMDLFM